MADFITGICIEEKNISLLRKIFSGRALKDFMVGADE